MTPTYQQLQDDILAWLRRETSGPPPNIGSQLEQITRMAEELIYYGSEANEVPGLRCPELWQYEVINFPANDPGMALDDQILELDEVFTQSHSTLGSVYGHIATPHAVFQANSGPVVPTKFWYALQGSRLEISPVSATPFDLVLCCYKRPDYLDIDSTPHTAFRNHYSVWLAAGCWSACVYLRMVEFAEYWRRAVAELIKNANHTQIRRVGTVYAQKGQQPPHWDSQVELARARGGGGSG